MFLRYHEHRLMTISFKQLELEKGFGVLEAKRALNCEKRKNYKFEIVAVMCDGSKSER